MKYLFFTFFFILQCILLIAQTNPNHVYVKGHYRNGTYVKPHYRTAPNSTNRDNFSTLGNTNPYTGEAGWILPDNNSTPTYNNSYNTRNNSNSTYPTYGNSSSGSTYNSTNYSESSSSNYQYSSAKYEGSTNSLGQKVITYSNGKEIFDLCSNCYTTNYDKNLIYHWYSPTEGVKESEGTSKGKLLNGTYKFYNEKGNLIITGNYNKGLKHGNFIIKDELGNIEEKIHYTNGRIDYAKFTNDSGYIIEWIGGFLSSGSVKKVYNSNNVLIEQATIGDDFIFHYELFFEENGGIEAKFSQDLFGKYHDKYTSFYINGEIEFEAEFKGGLRFGIWKWYNENGEITNRKTYNIHEEKYYNGNSKLKGSQYYDFDNYIWVKDGIWIEYENDGETQKNVTYYKDGIITEDD